MVDVEQDIMGSNADFDLRSKISSVKGGDSNKEGIPKKWWIIGGSVIGAIIVVLLLFLLVFNTQNVKFTFYLNDALVTENLDVTVSYEDTVLTLTSNVEILEVELPKKIDVTLEVTSVGYQTKQIFFIEEDAYDVKIVKATTIADLGGEEVAQDVSFYVYKFPSTTSLYTSSVSLSLKCLSSGKISTLVVSGSKDYTKPVDCGSLQVTGNPVNFKAINQTCTGSLCNIFLYDLTDQTPQEQASGLKNNLIVKAVTHKKQEAMDGVHVSLEKGVTILSDGNTDMNGEIIFYDVPVGIYTVVGEVKVKSKIFQEQATVEVYASSEPVKKTLEFDLKKSSGGSGGSGSTYEEEDDAEGNTLYLTVNTFNDAECDVGVDVFDVNGKSEYSKSETTGEKIEIGGLENGNYYLGVVPLGDCSSKYSPIYNQKFEMPKDQQMEITLEEFDKDNLVILIISPKYNGQEVSNVAVDIYDSDLNQNKILSDINPQANGEVGFVLFKNKKYNILGNKNDAYKASVLNYNFPTAFLDVMNGENYWLDNLDLNLTHESAEVTFNVFFNGVPLNASKQFTISANIKDLGELSYTGTGSSKKIEVPKNTETLFKVSYSYKKINSSGTVISTTLYNYYVNPLTFSADTVLDIDFSESLAKPKTFLPKIYLDKALIIDGNNLNVTQGKQYFVPFDVMSSEGFLGDKIFALGFEDLKSTNFFEFDKSEAYSLNTEDFNFASVVQGDKVGSYLDMEGDKTQKDIFRVVLPVKIKSTVPASSKGYLKYTQALPNNQFADGNIEFWTGTPAVPPLPQGDEESGTDQGSQEDVGEDIPYDNQIDVYIGKSNKAPYIKNQKDSVFIGKDACDYEVVGAKWTPSGPYNHVFTALLYNNLIKNFGLPLDLKSHLEKIYSFDSKTGVLDIDMNVNQDTLVNMTVLPDWFNTTLILDLNKTDPKCKPLERATAEEFAVPEENDIISFIGWPGGAGPTPAGAQSYGASAAAGAMGGVGAQPQIALNQTFKFTPTIFNSSFINKVENNMLGTVFKYENVGGVQPQESADKLTKQVYVTFVLHKDKVQSSEKGSSPKNMVYVNTKSDAKQMFNILFEKNFEKLNNAEIQAVDWESKYTFPKDFGLENISNISISEPNKGTITLQKLNSNWYLTGVNFDANLNLMYKTKKNDGKFYTFVNTAKIKFGLDTEE